MQAAALFLELRPLKGGFHLVDRNNERARVWAFVFYPDSAPENWREIIQSWHVPAVVSPLHQFDKNPDGEPKKPHWHGLLAFDGKKSWAQVAEMIDSLEAFGPIRVESIRGMVRYFIHLDNPEKHQYNRSDMVCFSGFDADQYFAFADVQRHAELKKMRAFCQDNCITEFCDFALICDEQFPIWAYLLDTSCALPMRYFLQSAHFKYKEGTNRE